MLHQQGLDTTTPSGKAMFQLMGVFAEFERAIVRAELQAAGARSLRAIARGLNERGIRTPRGTSEWKAGSVAQLLARL
jgi:DNA invertase Pin-like site-specific DNA recombinase